MKRGNAFIKKDNVITARSKGTWHKSALIKRYRLIEGKGWTQWVEVEVLHKKHCYDLDLYYFDRSCVSLSHVNHVIADILLHISISMAPLSWWQYCRIDQLCTWLGSYPRAMWLVPGPLSANLLFGLSGLWLQVVVILVVQVSVVLGVVVVVLI